MKHRKNARNGPRQLTSLKGYEPAARHLEMQHIGQLEMRQSSPLGMLVERQSLGSKISDVHPGPRSSLFGVVMSCLIVMSQKELNRLEICRGFAKAA
jgi:hypothetical protein